MIYGCYPVFIVIGVNAYIVASPFLFQELLGLSMVNYGKIAILTGIMVVIGGAINTQLLNKFSPEQILNNSWILVLISGGTMLVLQLLGIHNVLSLLIPCLIFFISIPFMAANSNALSYSYIKSDFGAAGSLVTFVQLFTGFLSTGLMSFFSETTYYPLASTIIFCAITGKLTLIIADRIDSRN